MLPGRGSRRFRFMRAGGARAIAGVGDGSFYGGGIQERMASYSTCILLVHQADGNFLNAAELSHGFFHMGDTGAAGHTGDIKFLRHKVHQIS